MSIGQFIDGAYMYKALPGCMDYKKLRSHVESKLGDCIDDAYFFNGDLGDGSTDKLHAALAMPHPRGPGFRVKLYPVQFQELSWSSRLGGMPVVHPDNHEIRFRQPRQKGVDVGLAFNMWRSHQNRGWTKLVLGGGDADFSEVVQWLVEEKNVELHLIGSTRSISRHLLQYARSVFEIDTYPLRAQLRWQRHEHCVEEQFA